MDKILFSSIEAAIKDIQKGKMIIVVDDEDRENEGDFVMAAEYADAQSINFMATVGRGMICAPITNRQAKRLGLDPMVGSNTSQHETAFTITVDAANGITTGISASDRAKTLNILANEKAQAAELARPGHIFPLIAKDKGVIERNGHTEASVDLCKLAGLRPAGVICEIMNEDGTMARLPELAQMAQKYDLKLISIKDLVLYRQSTEINIKPVEEIDFPNKYGNFKLQIFQHEWDDKETIVISKGDIQGAQNPLVRLHSQCFTGDIFGSQRCDCGEQLDHSMKMIEQAGEGLIIYLQQEGRGIGLVNKIKAYKLQEQGLDTVEANLKLGFKEELRDYSAAAQILRFYGISSIQLLTNNPHKIEGLKALNYKNITRVPINTSSNAHNQHYLLTKASRMGHLLEDLKTNNHQ